jgi:hypothetical protein
MFSLNHTSDIKKRLGYASQNLINQLQLNPQINENSEKYKNVRRKSKINTKRQLTTEKMSLASTYLGQIMLRFQDKDSIMIPYNFK